MNWLDAIMRRLLLLCGGWSSLRSTNINTYSFIYSYLMYSVPLEIELYG